MHLLKVFDAICKTTPDYTLTLVGDGPQKSQLIDYAKTNNLNVRFLGALSHAAVIAELPHHGIYLHTSVKESFSYALLEAKLSGLQTCAHSKLQVPAEFIDVPVNSFEVAEWRDAILKMDAVSIPFESNNFTSNNMMHKSIELAR
jgi:glycosyltransferase involved in cell wall biosynthesis